MKSAVWSDDANWKKSSEIVLLDAPLSHLTLGTSTRTSTQLARLRSRMDLLQWKMWNQATAECICVLSVHTAMQMPVKLQPNHTEKTKTGTPTDFTSPHLNDELCTRRDISWFLKNINQSYDHSILSVQHHIWEKITPNFEGFLRVDTDHVT